MLNFFVGLFDFIHIFKRDCVFLENHLETTARAVIRQKSAVCACTQNLFRFGKAVTE